MANVVRSPSRNSLDMVGEPSLKRQRLTLPADTDPDKPIVVPAMNQSIRIKKRRKAPVVPSGSSEDVLMHDVKSFLGDAAVQQMVESGSEWDAPIQSGEIVDIEVGEMSSVGESLALLPAPHPPWVIVVPFALPGEKVRIKIIRHSMYHSHGKVIEILVPNHELRDMARVRCKYFGLCGGCQYQMLSYDKQLELKRRVVMKAYENYSNLLSTLVPEILPTIPSPSQYGYRTKITPHFDIPRSQRKRKHDQKSSDNRLHEELNIGFNAHGSRAVVDIEECPIATPILNKALRPIRDEVKSKKDTYRKGATLLLRDSLGRQDRSISGTDEDTLVTSDTLLDSGQEHVCITDHKAIIREKVGDKLFEFPANDFFQNNNSILLPLVDYVRDAIFPSHTSLNIAPTHLVDTYCGSGLFSILLSPYFDRVAGVEISAPSIQYAGHNAKLNGLPTEKCVFHCGNADQIFNAVGDFPPLSTAVVIDPPRKGCDEAFIQQLLAFRPRTLVYVSCNVHTQARDVGMIITESRRQGTGYILESLRGFDLFPQTSHVESVAVLRLAR